MIWHTKKARERESSLSKKQKQEARITKKIRINMGVAFARYKSLMRDTCFQSEA